MNINLEPNEQNNNNDDDDDKINNLELHFHILTQIKMKERIFVCRIVAKKCGKIKTKFVYLSLIGSFHLGFLAKV